MLEVIEGSCKAWSSGQNRDVVLLKLRWLWLPAQDQANQYSNLDGRRDPKFSFLVECNRHLMAAGKGICPFVGHPCSS